MNLGFVICQLLGMATLDKVFISLVVETCSIPCFQAHGAMSSIPLDEMLVYLTIDLFVRTGYEKVGNPQI